MSAKHGDNDKTEAVNCTMEVCLYRIRVSKNYEGIFTLIKEVPAHWKPIEERDMSSAVSAALAAERLSFLDEACLGVVYDGVEDNPELDADQAVATFKIQ